MKRLLAIIFAVCLLLSFAGCQSRIQKIEMLVYLEDDLTEAEARTVGSRLNCIPDVINSRFVTGEEALEDFISKQENPSDFAGIDADFISSRYIVTAETTDVQALVKELESWEEISSVSYFII